MDQIFHCDLCHREILLAELCQDETIFTSGWTICARCEPVLRQGLVLHMAGRQRDEPLAQHRVDPPLEKQRRRNSPQNEEIWTFPHIVGSAYRPAKKYGSCIDAYTASYMRWQNKLHVLAWLDSFGHQYALRPAFLDTETTGTRRFSEVIEICIVDEYGQTLFRSLVNPTTEIEPMASAVHGLSRRDVKNAPRYPAIHEEVMSYLHNRIVIAYNASFDIRLLKQTADCYELAFPALHIGCLMHAYAKYREEYVEHSNGQRRCKTHRLEAAMVYERLDMPPLHRAERDAQCVHRLFQAMKARSHTVHDRSIAACTE
jgi:DNA polymerase III epsilon subunit-like protein